MELKDSNNTYEITPSSDGDQYWLIIAKNGTHIASPDIDANKLAQFIRELKRLYDSMADIA